MTVKSRSVINSEADANIQDNTAQEITPADVRQRVKDLADSSVIKSDDLEATLTNDAAKVPKSSAVFAAIAAAKLLVESISFQDINTSIAAQVYVIEFYAAYAYTINQLKIIAGGGTCTAAVKINGTPVTGISAVGVSTSVATGTASAANSVAVGDKVTLEITSPSTLDNLQASIKTTRT